MISVNLGEPGVTWWWSSRFVLAILGCWAFLNMTTQLMLVQSSLRCMLNHTKIGVNELYSTGLDNNSLDCTEVFEGHISTLNVKNGLYEWTPVFQNMVSETALWGFTLSAFISGFLATKYGGKIVLAAGHFLMAFSSVMSPIAASVQPGFLIFTQTLVGIGAGTTFPAMHALWRNWAPPDERTRLAVISFAGIPLGILMADSFGGLICDKSVEAVQWPSMFFIHGSLIVIWFSMWVSLVSDTPEKSSRALAKEKFFIKENLPGSDLSIKGFCQIRFKEMLFSRPVIALIQSHIFGELGFFVLTVFVPRFFRTYMMFNVHIIGKGVFYGLPFILLFCTMFPAAALVDYLHHRRKPSNTATRKIIDGIGKCGAAWMLFGVGFLDCTSWTIAVALWALAISFQAFQYSGHMVNHLDLAPRYAAILMGISCSLAGGSRIICHHLFDLITKNNSKEEFQIVIFSTCALMTVSAILYALLASGEIQHWNTDGFLSTAGESPHSEHAALQANMSKIATMSDDYGASNRGGLRASELDSRSEVDSSFETEHDNGGSTMAQEDENQWIKFKARHADQMESESDERVPIGVPAVRSRTNTMERPAKNKMRKQDGSDECEPNGDQPSEVCTATAAQYLMALSPPDIKNKAIEVDDPHFMSDEFPVAQENGHLQYGWRDVLMAELGPNSDQQEISIQPRKPKRFKRDLIDFGSFENEDRDDSGMATEASATSSNLNGMDDKGWMSNVVGNIPQDMGQFNVPSVVAYGDNSPDYLNELLQLGDSSNNLCSENILDASTKTTGVHSDNNNSTSSSLDKKSLASMSRQTQTDISLSPAQHSNAGKQPGDVYADSVESILDSETSIPLVSDGEPLVTRI